MLFRKRNARACARALALGFGEIFERTPTPIIFILIVAILYMIHCLLIFWQPFTVFGAYIYFVVVLGGGGAVGLAFWKVSHKIAERLSAKTRRADGNELNREDDILLQAVAFSQSLFFIYLNLIPTSGLVTLYRVLVPIATVLFYTLRAWGKIENESKYRYWSILLFFWICLQTLFYFPFALRLHIQPVFLELQYQFGLYYAPLYVPVLFGLIRIIEEVFRKRYDYQHVSRVHESD